MSNELAIITPNEWQAMTEQANALVKSGFLPSSIKTPQQAIAIMMLGRELGIGAWAAMTSINVIQGKPTISPQLMLALINRSGQLDDFTVTEEDGATVVTMKRKGRTAHTERFTDEDAKTLGLLNKDNWIKQRKTMRKWRSVAACARVCFSDVLLGMYTPEEMGADVTADDMGNMTVIEVKAEPVAAHSQLVEKTVDADTGEVVEQKPDPTQTAPLRTPFTAPPREGWQATREEVAERVQAKQSQTVTASEPIDLEQPANLGELKNLVIQTHK